MTPGKQAIKRATRELVAAAGGQVEAAGFTRFKRHQALSDHGNPQMPDSFMPIDAIVDLEAVTVGKGGHPLVTRELARQAGYELVPLPTPVCPSVDWHAHLAAIAKESNDVLVKLLPRLADGRLTAREIRTAALVGEVDEALSRFVELRHALLGVLTDTG